ncbi:Helix-turn-helix [Ralstonia sp. 25mfcol4.1]|uniref:helix-turn-helix domain-containing protein n=1 Tax=Ralstonia sp. 25mfcol4.1 TaxID=1761899 RepID=UPI00087E3688|nr:helix-turn-helix transcriptional regulator [Ralstonia sp. 25mfcol4.1]SDP38472.1 Helix-turn-helix [Ralstonia sp. 25mfcol4.1]
MSYQELIAKALHGRSVRVVAQEMGVPQQTFNRYARGDRLPDYATAFLLAKEAGMDPREVFLTLAEEEAKRKGLEIFSKGFNALLSLVKPRRTWVPAW